MPTAEPRPQEEGVKDHVKQAWEEVKVDLTGEDDDDEQMQDDDDVTVKSPEEEPQPEEDDDDRTSKENDINDERRDFREQDEVDEFLNEEREQAEKNDDEETEGGEVNIEEYEADEARDAVIEYPAWLKRIEFGSKVLPVEPCMIGDAQPELIKILLLQIGLNILRIYRIFQRNFCGTYEAAWQHFQLNQKFRLDLDPKVPYLGVDADGNLIEPTAQQMRELYSDVGKPDQKDDIGEEGFVNAYYGAIVFKRLVTYTLECGYTFDDLQNLFVDENIAQLTKGDTTEEEMRKAANAREALDRQTTLVRRIIAGAYKVNAVYFFRNVDFQNTITLNPVDIVCALRPQLRRISVLHLILQNGRQLPRPLLTKLYDAIEGLQQHQTTWWSTAKVGHPHVWSPLDCNCRYSGSSWSWARHTGSWQIESSTEAEQCSESKSIIINIMAYRWSCSSAKAGSSASAAKGWKRLRERE